MKKLLKIFFLLSFINLALEANGPHVGCQWYGDDFGPLQSGYTMGDLVRYTVTPELNVYSKMVVAPVGASDIYKLYHADLNNGYNLYNALGYLYAGWALFNSSQFTDSAKWVTTFRTAHGGAREALDNNQECRNTIEFNLTSTYTAIPTKSINLPGTSEYATLKTQPAISLKDTPIGANYFNTTSILDQLSGNAQEGNDWSLRGLADFNYQSGDSTGAFGMFFGHFWQNYGGGVVIDNTPIAASASASFCSNASDGDMVMYFVEPYLQHYEQLPIMVFGDRQGHSMAGSRVYPTGQFFGARIAHILGAVVNDVPWQSDNSSVSTNTTGGATGTFTSTLLSGSGGTALPMIAVMDGNSAGWTITNSGGTITSTAPSEMFQPSTAHFGSLNTYWTSFPSMQNLLGERPSSELAMAYDYINLHIIPMVNRLKPLCSYNLNSNLININSPNVTPYDNGVVVAIQNNTGDELTIYQGTPLQTNQIGTLAAGNNNYFLHTASLMPSSAATSSVQNGTSSSAPNQSQMISIIDTSSNNIGTYIQILSGTQLVSLYNALNTEISNVFVPNQTSNYNQAGLTYQASMNAAYVVITNFNPSLDSSNTLNVLNLPKDTQAQQQIINSYRIQAVNVDEFSLQPYLLTMQINKENIGYGIKTNYETEKGNYTISGYSLSAGSKNNFILFPSIVSTNVFQWQNYLNATTSTAARTLYTNIPLLMVPDEILNAGILGFKAYYIIWLMSYAAAMTECSYNGAGFGDVLSVYDKVFNLFSSKTNKFTFDGSATSNVSRVVVDQKGSLLSGNVLQLDNDISICGCDTWDSGGGFNQDISIVNLYTDAQGAQNNVIPNKDGQNYVNLIATFGTQKIVTSPTDATTTFYNAYGLPYSNTVMFALPVSALKDGVNIQMVTLESDVYQLLITARKKYKDQWGNHISAGSTLAAPKVFIDMNLYDLNNVTFDFMRLPNDMVWKSPQVIEGEISNLKYRLKYSNKKNKQSLKLNKASSKKTITNKKIKSKTPQEKVVAKSMDKKVQNIQVASKPKKLEKVMPPKAKGTTSKKSPQVVQKANKIANG